MDIHFLHGSLDLFTLSVPRDMAPSTHISALAPRISAAISATLRDMAEDTDSDTDADGGIGECVALSHLFHVNHVEVHPSTPLAFLLTYVNMGVVEVNVSSVEAEVEEEERERERQTQVPVGTLHFPTPNPTPLATLPPTFDLDPAAVIVSGGAVNVLSRDRRAVVTVVGGKVVQSVMVDTAAIPKGEHVVCTQIGSGGHTDSLLYELDNIGVVPNGLCIKVLWKNGGDVHFGCNYVAGSSNGVTVPLVGPSDSLTHINMSDDLFASLDQTYIFTSDTPYRGMHIEGLACDLEEGDSLTLFASDCNVASEVTHDNTYATILGGYTYDTEWDLSGFDSNQGTCIALHVHTGGVYDRTLDFSYQLVSPDTPYVPDDPPSLLWLWVLIGVVVTAGAVAGGCVLWKKKQSGVERQALV
ncbi:hypothetical protein KIPB_002393 [Kipferlia bialata]|uniref:Uncharacterized protein n=1 Tax=Kipferlia bialata TaxID=797122 RepID=A0A9K3GG72_9EUKA|nr:hypothetical protein KIPB_002393 [Kipferlia bialata]|eukprot:g2393.t1